MPKLPVDFVKAPGFDNPLRSTAANDAISERKLTLRLDEVTWEALLAACERESRTPEAVVGVRSSGTSASPRRLR